ncbi:hypothetical protein [Coleofasciculus sp. FACHB-SPT9]|uniref:hypothetical protein n=1 Tax=Cyanophyceae TaxID=3028117 RepID=UPI001689B644|nr:hypothetical protein [Coleofasciculus sp. FACHB-SPT9]MBD1893061.1 hypothetical protein [Coleofasciculus sp. FACHB-SPT9]
MADFDVSFPDGQYLAHGCDLNTAIALSDAFHKGSDPQPIIERIADPEVRVVAQRITNNLSEHSARGKRK